MSERKPGWYWVTLRPGDEPIPAEWIPDERFPDDKECWSVLGHFFSDQDLHEIGLRIPVPGEPWQTVPVEPTREMLESTGDNSAEAYAGMLGAWTAMLAAAPKPGGG